MYDRLNLLGSFAYMNDDGFFQDLMDGITPYANILIDSGAHTNHRNRIRAASGKKNSQKSVTLDEYCRYLLDKKRGDIWQYIALDVIRNPAETKTNLEEMKMRGLKPMPVFIEGYTRDDLPALLGINERIAVAGAVGSHDAYIRRRYKEIYELSGSRAKIHGLGYGRYPGTFHAQFKSCDSASFSYGSQYGLIYKYERDGGFKNITWKDLLSTSTTTQDVRAKFIAYMADLLKLKASDLHNIDTYKGKDVYVSPPNVTCVFSYLDFAQHVGEFQKDYFIAAANSGFILNIIVCAACVGMGDTSLKNIRDIYATMKHGKGANDKVIESAVALLKEYTNWQIRPHSL